MQLARLMVSSPLASNSTSVRLPQRPRQHRSSVLRPPRQPKRCLGTPPGRKSTTGYAMRLCSHLLHLLESGSVTQATVVPSTAEAEFLAMVRGSASALFLLNVGRDIGLKIPKVVMPGDSAAARGTVAQDGLSSKMKHLDIKHCWLQG